MEMIVINVRIHMNGELWGMKDLTLLSFTSTQEFSGSNLTIEIINACHMS
jgi:hypothetical protein